MNDDESIELKLFDFEKKETELYSHLHEVDLSLARINIGSSDVPFFLPISLFMHLNSEVLRLNK
jgi:hypothetical protein